METWTTHMIKVYKNGKNILNRIMKFSRNLVGSRSLRKLNLILYKFMSGLFNDYQFTHQIYEYLRINGIYKIFNYSNRNESTISSL